jgi:hypothetical protein
MVIVETRCQEEQEPSDQRAGQLAHGKAQPRVLAFERDQTGRAVGGCHPEDDQNGGNHAQQSGFPAELAGVADRAQAHIASTAARNRSPRSS